MVRPTYLEMDVVEFVVGLVDCHMRLSLMTSQLSNRVEYRPEVMGNSCLQNVLQPINMILFVKIALKRNEQIKICQFRKFQLVWIFQ